MKNSRKKIRFGLGILLACCAAAGLHTEQVWSNNLKKFTEVTVSFREPPRYTGEGVVPEEFMTVQVFTDLENEEQTELTGLPISYSFYNYREDRPDGPDESIDKLDWDETPSQVGTYWVKAKFLGNNQYRPSSSDYYQFQIVQAVPRLEISTNMTEETRIGDTIVVTAGFQGIRTEPENFQPRGKAVFQAGDRFIDQAVDFYGNKAEVSYTLTTEPVDIKVEYVPANENENYTRAEAVLQGIMGIKREQEPLVIAGETVAYGVEPYILSVTGGSGEGKLSYASADESIASINEKGKITIHHPGTVEIRAAKAEDDTYAQAEASYQLTVSKGLNPDKPKLPVLMETSSNRIRVKKTEGQEFSIDGGKKWSESGVFEKLTPKKKYTVITRLCETELYYPGRSTKFLQVTTERKNAGTTPAPSPGTGNSGGSGGGNEIGGGNGNNENPGGGTLTPAPAAQGRQWNSLGGSSTQTGTGTDTAGTAGKTGKKETAESTKRKTAAAKGKVKGSQSEQAEEAAEEKMAEDEAQDDAEDAGMNEEILGEPEQEENKIVSTGAARPKKKGIPIAAAVAGILVLGGGAGAAGWAVKVRKRRLAV